MQFIYLILYGIFHLIIIEAGHHHHHQGDNKNLFVELQNGKLKGRDRGNYYSFESIPYAEPPIGNLRFEAPQPYQQKWTGIFNASVEPKRCIQWNYFLEGENKLDGVEDCLTVNVYKPKTGRNKYPVVVYIHGGGFLFSAPNDFKEDFLMKSGKVIFVTLTYRLGALGYLSTEDDIITGNFGMKDQQLALKWVKDNIHNFGGDPEKILLIGFSSGAGSTHLLLLTPTLKDVVNKVISFSGVAVNPWAIFKEARNNAIKFAQHLKCPHIKNSQQIKNCLTNMKAEDIAATAKEYTTLEQDPFDYFGPVIEHKDAPHPFITQHPIDILKSGQYSHLPFLASYAAQDGCSNSAELLFVNPKTGKQYIDELNEKWPEKTPNNLFLKHITADTKEYAQQLKAKYLGNQPFSEKTYGKVQDMYTDIIYKNGILEALKLHSLNAKAPVYSYVYDNPANRNETQYGTCHGDDFGLILSDPMRSLRPDEKVISQKLIQMVEDFIETGELSFGDCKFVNNVGNADNLKSLLITKDKCETITQKVQ